MFSRNTNKGYKHTCIFSLLNQTQIGTGPYNADCVKYFSTVCDTQPVAAGDIPGSLMRTVSWMWLAELKPAPLSSLRGTKHKWVIVMASFSKGL